MSILSSTLFAQRIERRLKASEQELSKTLVKQATKHAVLSSRVARLRKIHAYALKRLARVEGGQR